MKGAFVPNMLLGALLGRLFGGMLEALQLQDTRLAVLREPDSKVEEGRESTKIESNCVYFIMTSIDFNLFSRFFLHK